MIDRPQIEGVGIETHDLLARSGEIVPDVGLSDFVVSVKHDRWCPCKPAFDGIVKVTVGVIEQGKGSSRLATGVEEHPSCESGDGDAGLEEIDVPIEIHFLQIFDGLDERPDVQVVVPYQKILEGRHPVLGPDVLTVSVVFRRDVGVFQRTEEVFVGW